jgi:hypothetical protein
MQYTQNSQPYASLPLLGEVCARATAHFPLFITLSLSLTYSLAYSLTLSLSPSHPLALSLPPAHAPSRPPALLPLSLSLALPRSLTLSHSLSLSLSHSISIYLSISLSVTASQVSQSVATERTERFFYGIASARSGRTGLGSRSCLAATPSYEEPDALRGEGRLERVRQ